MANLRIKWNRGALYELRSEPGVIAEANAHLQRICERANSMSGGTFNWESHQGRKAPQGRWRGTVFPTDWRAARDNRRDNILIRAING